MEIKLELKNAVDSLGQENFDDLVRSEELGRDYSFRVAVELIKKIHTDLKDVVENAEGMRVPSKTEEQILSLANGVNEQIKKIKTFV